MGMVCSLNGDKEECIYVIDGKVRRKEATKKAYTQVGEKY
jgi:hypothetical protein